MPSTIGSVIARRLPAVTAEMWHGEAQESTGRMILLGCLVWLFYGIVHVALQGPILDEIVQPAQILAGQVSYPSGHPHQVFYTEVFYLPNWLGALVTRVFPAPAFLSGIRNVTQLLLSGMVPFVLLVILTRRPMWGIVAATLSMSNLVSSFQGLYPFSSFPGYYGTGQLGMLIGLLIVMLLLGSFWRTGGLLLGLMPSLHAALAAVVWPWAAAFLVAARFMKKGISVRPVLTFTAIGIGACLILAAVISLGTHGTVDPLYIEHSGGEVYRRNFIRWTEEHRQPIPVWSLAYLVNPLVYFMLCARLLLMPRSERARQQQYQTAIAGLLLLGVIVWSVVAFAKVMQEVATVPGILEMFMPSRLSNMTALLLPPLIVAAFADLAEGMKPPQRAATLVLLAGIALLAGLRPFVLHRELSFLVLAVLLAAEVSIGRREWRIAVAAAFALVGCLSIAFSNGLSFVVGFGIAYPLLWFCGNLTGTTEWGTKRWAEVVLAFSLIATLVMASFANREPEWAAPSSDDRGIQQWLRSNAGRHEMVLPAIFEWPSFQIKTGQPVLLELETLWIMTYMPRLSGIIGRMTQDLYGIDYRDSARLEALAVEGMVRTADVVWQDIWMNRSVAEWRHLSSKYDFRLVLSHPKIPLQLPVVWAGSKWVLYSIPPSA